jgi:hypothetical protein
VRDAAEGGAFERWCQGVARLSRRGRELYRGEDHRTTQSHATPTSTSAPSTGFKKAVCGTSRVSASARIRMRYILAIQRHITNFSLASAAWASLVPV